MTPTRFFLVRHALVEPSARAVLYGSMDVALCDLALQEEAASYRWLAHRLPQPARWFVTNLSRTRATAAAVFAAGYPDAGLETEPDFAEQHLGDWQGIPHEALPALLTRPRRLRSIFLPQVRSAVPRRRCQPPGDPTFPVSPSRRRPRLRCRRGLPLCRDRLLPCLPRERLDQRARDSQAEPRALPRRQVAMRPARPVTRRATPRLRASPRRFTTSNSA